MTRFIPATDLKADYDVFGHFYSVKLASKEVIECRSVLEIVGKMHMPSRIAALATQRPDAVFIMMNPGSSRPLAEVSNRIPAKAIGKLSISLVPTKPDTTQYQVMRVMRYCKWRHVRVLNLSDLRCSKSGMFYKQYRQLEDMARFDSHSIFSEARRHELSMKLPKSRKTPVVFAWGVSDKLDPLIERCRSMIPRSQIIRGLLKEGVGNKYFHPLPSLQRQKLLWVKQMVKCCKG